MSLAEEFLTVDLILNSTAETRGVDAFALALIKAEKQMRRLVTHLVYQSPAFGRSDRRVLRKTLESNSKVYFNGLECGFDALYPRTVRDLIGPEYEALCARLDKARTYRNKIFHGQLTADGLTRSQLSGFVSDIRRWSERLAKSCRYEFGYEGFSNSFRKSTVVALNARLLIKLGSAYDYRNFIREYMELRQRKKPADHSH